MGVRVRAKVGVGVRVGVKVRAKVGVGVRVGVRVRVRVAVRASWPVMPPPCRMRSGRRRAAPNTPG